MKLESQRAESNASYFIAAFIAADSFCSSCLGAIERL
jgi:hypothetical protein